MPAVTRWWVPDPEVAEPSARWLGIFRRRVFLKSSPPSRLSVPAVNQGTPTRIEGSSSVSQPGTVAAELDSPAPQQIGGGELAPGSEGGSVALAGVLLDVERSPLRPGQDTPEERLWQRLKLHGPGASEEEGRVSLAKRLAYLLQPPTDSMISPCGPLEWPATLFPYQTEGVQALLSRSALLLADDMGLGKTVQAVAALRVLAVQHRLQEALVVAPASLLVQWRKALRFWAPELRISTVYGTAPERAYQWSAPAHVFLTSYDTLRSDFTTNPASPPRRRTWDVVILDEAQKIKNRDADVSQKCKSLVRRRAWALTGTPLENQLDDLASILEFVSPLAAGQSPLRVAVGPALLERHRSLQLRRKKADVLKELPPKTTSHLVLPLLDSQRESYKRAEEQGILRLREMGEDVRIENVLELILRLKQICNFCPQTAQSAKLEDVTQRVATLVAEGHRALVFSQFTDARFGVAAIASKLTEFNPLQYSGALGSADREAVLQSFRSDAARSVLVLSLRAGGLGLNLQEASYVFHFDRWWNPAVEHQAEDRVHRLGQTSPVHVYKYTCEGTIEDRIHQILEDKQALFKEIVDDVSIDLKVRLSADELFGLFGLTPPRGARTSAGKSGITPDYSTMSGVEFEQHVKGSLERRGWAVDQTPPTRDGGVDLIARRAVDLGGDMTLYIQCKNAANLIGVEVVRQLNGVLPKYQPGCRGIVVCPGGFTTDAQAFARDRGILLWERKHLFELSGPS